MPDVAADDIGKRHRAVVASLRIPTGVEAENDMQHMAGLNQHHDRREQGGQHDFEKASRSAA